MTTIRAKTQDVLAHVRDALAQDAQRAAGNQLLSRGEEAALPDGVIKHAAQELRASQGPGARVDVEALVDTAFSQVSALLHDVNSSGPTSVSQQEVRALHALDPDAGARVAKAYELITGKRIELPTSTAQPPVVPVTPPVLPPTPGPVGRVAVAAVTASPPPEPPYAGPLSVLPDGAVQLERGGMVPSTYTLEVGGRTFTATIDGSERMSGRVTNVATTADMVEAFRKAVAPDYDLRVTRNSSGQTVFELWAAPAPPPEHPPVYLYPELRNAAGTKLYAGVELRAPLTWVCGQDTMLEAGSSLSLRIDHQVFTATARAGDSMKRLVRALRDQAVAAGRTVDLREYANYAPWTFKVIG